MLSLDDLLLWVYYQVDSELQAMNLGRLRQRGPQPTLADSEVITIELVGEFLGLETDQAMYQHFHRYPLREFPNLAKIDRTTFARQAANLGGSKNRCADAWSLRSLGKGLVRWWTVVRCRSVVLRGRGNGMVLRGKRLTGRMPWNARPFMGFDFMLGVPKPV